MVWWFLFSCPGRLFVFFFFFFFFFFVFFSGCGLRTHESEAVSDPSLLTLFLSPWVSRPFSRSRGSLFYLPFHLFTIFRLGRCASFFLIHVVLSQNYFSRFTVFLLHSLLFSLLRFFSDLPPFPASLLDPGAFTSGDRSSSLILFVAVMSSAFLIQFVLSMSTC